MHHQKPTLIFTSNPSGYVWRADLRWDTCQWCTAKKAPGHWCSAPTMSLRSTWRGSSSWMGSTIAAQREGQSAWKIKILEDPKTELGRWNKKMTWIITWLQDITRLHDNSCFGPHLEEKERTVCRCDPLTTDGTSKWTACMQAAAQLRFPFSQTAPILRRLFYLVANRIFADRRWCSFGVQLKMIWRDADIDIDVTLPVANFARWFSSR